METQAAEASATANPNSAAHLERRVAQVRWLAIAIGAASGSLLGLGGRQLVAFYGVVALAAAYNALLSRAAAGLGAAWLLNPYPYGVAEVVLATAIIAVTGGASSPFYLIYFWVVIHAAVRFGGRPALLSSALVATGYLLVAALAPGDAAGHLPAVFLRTGFIAITAIFAGFLADRARAAEAALARQLAQARALNQAGAALTGSLEWAEVAQEVADRGRALAGADAAILQFHAGANLPEVGGSLVTGRAASALPAGAHLAKRLLQADLPAHLAPPDGEDVTRHDLAQVAARARVPLGALPQAALLRAPILVQRRWIGDLLLLRAAPRPPFEPGESDLVRAFANQATLSLENALLYERAREQATTDPLTGVLNHRALKERLDEELPRATRQGRGLCVLVLDIDHFKAFNDTFGHAAGDAALRAVAGALRGVLRSGDCAARFGGEEFVVALPDTDLAAGAAVAERLRARIAALIERPEALRDELPGRVTVSIGVAAYPDHGPDRERLLRAADLAMYLAKHSGRNRVCLATDLETARGIDALFAQLTGHLSLPDASWGPHLLGDLERRFASLAALRVDPDGQGLADGERAVYDYTVQTVTALAATIDAKDHYTEGHSRQVAALAVALAREAGCAREELETIRVGGLLHDLGKIGIPEALLHKPGPLTPEEWETMRAHPDIGARILAPIATLAVVVPLVRHHHERWDGEGYPQGLRGEAIPLGARIIAICDAYDTMTSRRTYRRRIPHEEALSRLVAAAGTQFDPQLVAHFARLDPDGARGLAAPTATLAADD